MNDKKSFWVRLRKDIARNKSMYILIIPVIAYFLIFHYKTMYGAVIAFQDYKLAKGIKGSEWVGFKHFTRIFKDIYFPRAFRNTLFINLFAQFFSFPVPIFFALILNEVRVKWFGRTVQTITYMPHFISSVVVCGLLTTYCSSEGLFNQIAAWFGIENETNLLYIKSLWYPIFVWSGTWQSFGWNSIIYLATLSGIDQEQYEAAKIDGASRLQQMRFITLPGLVPTISMLLILNMGGMLSVGHGKVLLLYNDLIMDVADVLSTYAYRKGILMQEYSYSTALGLFLSVINLIMVTSANKISKKLGQSGLF